MLIILVTRYAAHYMQYSLTCGSDCSPTGMGLGDHVKTQKTQFL